MQKAWMVLFLITCSWSAVSAQNGGQAVAGVPGCDHLSPQQCVGVALEAMGGRDRLQTLKSVRLQTIGHTLLMEQSYRQAPFITSYERDVVTMDLTGQRTLAEAKVTWPESDLNQPDSEATVIVGPEGGVYHSKSGDSPCGLATQDAARERLALGPARVLLTAEGAPDLHFEAPETVRESSHAVVAFTWQRVPVRLLLNPFNHLPDAVETTQEFQDFWYFWGDVQQRIYFDNWKVVQGISFPTNLVEERNGMVWSSEQALNIEFDVQIDDKAFAMDPEAAKQSAHLVGWNRPFKVKTDTPLASGIDLLPGAWNSTIVKEPDGVVILEAPISGLYTQGVIEEARKRYPGMPIKAVLSTSDSWPHTGGVRTAVAQGLAVFILDLNRPLLDRMVSAPHTLDPDALESAKSSKTPRWMIVSKKEEIGSGANRMELYPLRGASTERQYMVYFPEHHLLYASDTLAINDDGSLYDPELMSEVAQTVTREKLTVDKVYAMHQGPVAWDQVMALIKKARHA
ncbi:MAG: MBL fold metallo-hydrolase [Silvibacterium sp.]